VFTWLIITLWCNFPKQAFWVVGVRAQSLWLVQNVQTTKSLTPLGPALGSPFSNPTPPASNALRPLKKPTLADFCCIYFTFPSKSALPFVSCNGRMEILLMQVKHNIHINEKTPSYKPSRNKWGYPKKVRFFTYRHNFPLAQQSRNVVKTSLCLERSDKYYHALDLYWSSSNMYTHSTMLSLNIWSPECSTEWQITSGRTAAITGNNVPI